MIYLLLYSYFFYSSAHAHFVDDIQLNVEVKKKQLEFIVAMNPILMEELISTMSASLKVGSSQSDRAQLLFKASLARIAQHHQPGCQWQGNPSSKNLNSERILVKNILVCRNTPSYLEMDFAFLKELTLMKYAHLMGKVRTENNKMTSFSATPTHPFVKIPLVNR